MRRLALLLGVALLGIGGGVAHAGPGGRLTVWLEYVDGNGNRSVIGPRADGPDRGTWIYSYFPVRPDRSSSGRYSGGERAVRELSEGDVRRLRAAVRELEAMGSTGSGAVPKGTGRFEVFGESGLGTGPVRRFRVRPGPELERFDALLRGLGTASRLRIRRDLFRVAGGDASPEPRWRLRGAGRSWALPPIEKEIADEPDPEWQTRVDAVALGTDRWLVHLFAIDIHGKYVIGHDRFFVADRSRPQLTEIAPSTAPTLSRGEGEGCRTALEHRYRVADVDGDGALDLGIERRETVCEGSPLRPTLRESPIRWLRQSPTRWRPSPAHAGVRPGASVRFPWIGIERGPVEVVGAAGGSEDGIPAEPGPEQSSARGRRAEGDR